MQPVLFSGTSKVLSSTYDVRGKQSYDGICETLAAAAADLPDSVELSYKTIPPGVAGAGMSTPAQDRIEYTFTDRFGETVTGGLSANMKGFLNRRQAETPNDFIARAKSQVAQKANDLGAK